MSSIKKFDSISDAYDKYRPQYDLKVVKKISEYNDVPVEKKIVIDVGSGTGILTRQLMRCKFKKVIAVEPSDLMREISMKKCKGVAHINTVATDMKINKLFPDIGKVDLITVGTAIHWFEPVGTLKEFKRVLKKGGHVCIIICKSHPILESIRMVLDKEESALYKKVKEVYVPDKYPRYDTNITTFADDFHTFTSKEDVDITEEQYVGAQLTQSRAPPDGSPGHIMLVAGLKEIFNRHQIDGVIKIRIKTVAQICTI